LGVEVFATIIAYSLSAICIVFALVSFTEDMKSMKAGTMTPFKARNGLFIFIGFGALGWVFAYLGGL
jgi:hypothetical protein